MILEVFEELIASQGYKGIRYFFLIGEPDTKKAIGAVILKNYEAGCVYDIEVYSTKRKDIKCFWETNREILGEFACKELSRDIIFFHTRKKNLVHFLKYFGPKDWKIELNEVQYPSDHGPLYYLQIPVKEDE